MNQDELENPQRKPGENWRSNDHSQVFFSGNKRSRTLTAKALSNAIDTKRKKLVGARNRLKIAMQSAVGSPRGAIGDVLNDLTIASKAFKSSLHDLAALFDKNSKEYEEEAILTDDHKLINDAEILLERIKNEQTDKLSDKLSRRSKPLSAASSSSSARLRAQAAGEAAAAKKSAEYERIIAEKEHERKQREVEEQSRRERERAQHERELAVLEARKKEEIANAKLQAIENAMSEEGLSTRSRRIPLAPPASDRTREWVRDQHAIRYPPKEEEPRRDPPPRPNVSFPQAGTNAYSRGVHLPQEGASNRPFWASTPIRDITGSQLVETLTATNQQIVSGLARQNLPKCEPDVFDGDATLFQPWKRAFRAMMGEAEIAPEQEINYLRKFTSGEVQRVVNNFRKRQHHDPTSLLEALWSELERRFGNPAVIANTLLERLHQSSRFTEDDNAKLQEFADICADVDSQIDCLPGLMCLNFPNAIRPIAERMPLSLQSKWEKVVARHAEENHDAYPGFGALSRIVQKQARLKNHPNIVAGVRPTTKYRTDQRKILATQFSNSSSPTPKATEDQSSSRNRKNCLFHERDGHTLTECRAFKLMSLNERTDWIQKSGLCFLCLSNDHRAKECTFETICEICGDRRHNTLLHRDKPIEETKQEPTTNVASKCTDACGITNGGLSCSKILLVDVFPKTEPTNKHRAYAIIDDQSNASLISNELADLLGAPGPEEKYFLSTCHGSNEAKFGRRVQGLVAQSVIDAKESNLPTLIECENIPKDKREIPSPEMVKSFPHLKDIADEIPRIDQTADIHILLGRDAPEMLKVRAFRNGPRGAPWAQKLSLGWTVSGQICLDLVNEPVHVQTRRTKIMSDNIELAQGLEDNHRELDPFSGKQCDVVPCPNQFKVTDDLRRSFKNGVKDDVFFTQPDDNEASLSIDDLKFLQIMEKGIHKNQFGNWEMPLPFRRQEVHMPDNRPQAMQRLRSLTRTLDRKPQMKRDYLEFMEKVIEKGHASAIPTTESEPTKGKVWYLPHFGVYHPKKPTQIRVVFDSSAEYDRVSLNKELLSGPDLTNSLVGVLVRFRKEKVAVMCDVEQMFHSFHVSPEHRDFLRFLWYEDNDPQKAITEYRMNVHLFGNGPSPAVATFGLRRTANYGGEVSNEVKDFINRNFYVDDGLTSAPTSEQAVSLVRQARSVLATANLRLHKVASNSIEVMQAFPTADRAKDLRDLDLTRDSLPAQRSLGVYWNLENDTFTFQVAPPEKPFTRRGVLSIVNSVYDPLGLAAPVMINGKKLLQRLTVMGKHSDTDSIPLGWDDPLPGELKDMWQGWKRDLHNLESVSVPRCYRQEQSGNFRRAELHAFSDASQDAVAAVVYLCIISQNNDVSVSLVYGKAKVAPVKATSIPRLELCGAVMATQAASRVLKELDLEVSEVTYYTDSQVVLGYITNEGKRFHVYVANRVQLIRNLSSPAQWRYIRSEVNPADLATRGIRATDLQRSSWLNGPAFLKAGERIPRVTSPIQVSENDPELRKEVIVHATKLEEISAKQGLGAGRFERFSTFTAIRRALANLIVYVREFKAFREHKHAGKSSPKNHKLRAPTVEELEKATKLIIRESQRGLGEEKDQRTENQASLQRLDVFFDPDGLLRVGGRFKQMPADLGEKHPILLPKNHHVSTLMVRHYHQLAHHQGRQITHGALRQDGYWLVGGHRLIAKVLNACVTCRKLRGKRLVQQMANLPRDRTEVGPPFTNVGFDVFGPWTIVTRRTRGGAASSKRWGVVFTCLSSRAVHIEVIEAMDTSAFICALRRFFALRGPAALLRCDNGTNFVGAKNELEESMNKMEPEKIERFLTEHGCKWSFNPPHASHFGGVWERQIGTIRRVLDAMLTELGKAQLTHEILVTLMAEVTAIVNARPIATIPTDTDDPQPLSPSMLLTMKRRPLGPTPGEFLPADLYARRRWRRVQYLAEQFWTRWRREYLQNLQVRNKWQQKRRNLSTNDIVLLREDDQCRNDWPMARVLEAHKSDDGLVRKATLAVTKGGKIKTLLRPIKELILLVPAESAGSI